MSSAIATVGRLPFAFVDAALDRADAVRDDPDALSRLWADGRVLLIDDAGRVRADRDQQLHAVAARDLATIAGYATGDAAANAVFLGVRDGHGWFAMRVDAAADDTMQVDLRTAAGLWPAADATVFAQARAVLHWQARHRFCGVCGGAVAFVRAGWLGRCRQCGSDHYPRTDQAMIAAVTDGRRLLLGRQSPWPSRRYSVLAGFVEPGESLEQTVAREVFEEAGIRVLRCRYLASQPWPFPGSLMLGFMAEAAPDDPVIGPELEDVRWFDVDTVRAGLARAGESSLADDDAGILLSPAISIARWLIEQWLRDYHGDAIDAIDA